MGQFVWNPEWDTGFSNLDEQHRRLLVEFNDFLEAVHHDFHRKHITNLLEFLVDFLDAHFEEEEIHMLATHYPRFPEHKAFHDAMRARVQGLMDTSSKDLDAVVAGVVDFVKDWMENHISIEDRLMAKHLIQFSPKGSVPEF
ncbi:MAG: hemerythrin family protein [Geothrix sp.]|nr:hemerythrin family protein [Geothrix sp.]